LVFVQELHKGSVARLKASLDLLKKELERDPLSVLVRIVALGQKQVLGSEAFQRLLR